MKTNEQTKPRFNLRPEQIFNTIEEAETKAEGYRKHKWVTEVRNIEKLKTFGGFKFGVYLNGEKSK